MRGFWMLSIFLELPDSWVKLHPLASFWVAEMTGGVATPAAAV